MARIGINTGSTPDDGTGDSLRAGGGIINENFREIYTYLGAGSTTVLAAPLWGPTSVGINTLLNVGIGTTNPTSKLTIKANTSVDAVRITQDGSGNAFRVDDRTNDTTPFVITGVGTVGIGSTNPQGKLTLRANTSTPAVRITQDGSGNAFRVDDRTNDTTPFVITGTGSVGIGTTNPTSKLTVSGDGFFSGVITATSYIGDGSNLTGILDAGIGTPLSSTQSSPLSKIFKVSKTLTIGAGTSVSVEVGSDEGNVAFTRAGSVVVSSGATFRIASGTTFVMDAFRIFP